MYKLKVCLIDRNIIKQSFRSDQDEQHRIKSLVPHYFKSFEHCHNIFTKEYLGLTFVERKVKEAHSKAGKNVVKIKECLMKTYNQDGIKGLKKNELLFFMHLVDSEKDMANLCRMVEGYLGNATPDPKNWF